MDIKNWSKKLHLIVPLSLFFSFISCSDNSTECEHVECSNVAEKLKDADLCSDQDIPKEILEVKYDKYRVDCGNKLPLLAAREEPTVKYGSACSERYYLLVMYDRDTLFLQFLHWAVGNIQGNNVTEGDIIVSYLPPYPAAPVVDPHRYIFLLYEQPAKIDFTLSTLPLQIREITSPKEILKLCDMDSCSPLAANYFKAKADPLHIDSFLSI